MSDTPIGILGPYGWGQRIEFVRLSLATRRQGVDSPAFSYTTAVGRYSFVAKLGKGAFIQSIDNRQYPLPEECVGKLVVGNQLTQPNALPRTAAEDTLQLTGGTIPPDIAIGLGRGVLDHIRVVLASEAKDIPEEDRLDLTAARHLLAAPGSIELPPDRHSR